MGNLTKGFGSPRADNKFYGRNISLSNMKALFAKTTSGGNYDTFDSIEGTAYIVPASKKLIVLGHQSNSTGTAGSFAIGYGDTAVADAAGAPTNPVNNTNYCFIARPVASPVTPDECYIEIPTGKYPFIRSSGSAAFVHLICIEVDA